MSLPPTLLEILRKTEGFFEQAGIERPRIDAEWLIASVLGCKRLQLYLNFERPMSAEVLDRLRPLVARRARREPLQHILGTVDFAGLDLASDGRALIPRPETEALVAALLEEVKPPPARVLDLGTGSGAIALGLADGWPQAEVFAVDRSAEALALARENAERTGLADRVEWREGSWFGPVAGERFALIVSNPPYLTRSEWEEAEPEVQQHEPYDALVAPDEGLADLEQLIGGAGVQLEPGGLLALETGIAQHAQLAEVAKAAGFERWESRPDDSGRERYFLAWWSAL